MLLKHLRFSSKLFHTDKFFQHLRYKMIHSEAAPRAEILAGEGETAAGIGAAGARRERAAESAEPPSGPAARALLGPAAALGTNSRAGPR